MRSTTRLLRAATLACVAAGALAGSADAIVRPSATNSPATEPSVAGRIVGGAPAGDTAWPWIVHVSPAGGNCAGSVIAPTVVLTAAHCLVDEDLTRTPDRQITVTVGRRNLNGTGGRRIGVIRSNVPRNFDGDARNGNDIALLFLASPAGVQPAPVTQPGASLRSGDRAAIMGWGHTQEDGEMSNELLSALVPLVGFQSCKSSYAKVRWNMPATAICAGLPQGGVDSCQGDSGGPMMIKDAQGAWQQIGIVSFGYGCARAGLPGAYTNVIHADMAAFIRSGLAEVGAAPAPPTTTITPQPTGTQPGSTARPDVGNLELSRRAVRSGGRTHLTFAVPFDEHITVAVLRRTRSGLRRLPLLATGNAVKGLNRITIRTTRMRRGKYLVAIQADDGAGRRSEIRTIPLRIR